MKDDDYYIEIMDRENRKLDRIGFCFVVSVFCIAAVAFIALICMFIRTF